MKPVRILGIGSPAGDDQAGWLTIDALRALGVSERPDIVLDTLDRPGAGLVALLDGAEHVLLIDALCSGGTPGDIRHFNANDWPAPGADLSSHGFGVLAALALAQALGSLPQRVEVYGIEIASAQAGAPISATVRAAAQTLARRIADELAAP